MTQVSTLHYNWGQWRQTLEVGRGLGCLGTKTNNIWMTIRLRFHFCFQFPVSVSTFHFISISCFSICPISLYYLVNHATMVTTLWLKQLICSYSYIYIYIYIYILRSVFMHCTALYIPSICAVHQSCAFWWCTRTTGAHVGLGWS